MATHYLRPDSVLANLPTRDQIAAAIETMVTVLDLIDGDPDEEDNGDSLDGAAGEDDPLFHGEHPHMGNGPGCEISDCDAAVDDFPCDAELEGI